MAQYAREPRAYELMAILLPELADENLTAAIDQVTAHVASINGELREVLKDSPWGRRRLAYSIRFNGHDYRDGIYVIWHFSADPGSLGDLERELKLDTRVIRYLLVLEDPKWGSPQEREAAREMAEAPAAEPEAAPVAPAASDVTPPAEPATETDDQRADVAQDAGEESPATAETPESAAEVVDAPVEEAPATEEIATEAPAAEAESEAPAEESPATEDVGTEQPAGEAAVPANDETSSEENQ